VLDPDGRESIGVESQQLEDRGSDLGGLDPAGVDLVVPDRFT
jgi:hypothetical protein